MAGRFFVGAAVGLGGSFAILQRTTDRRIISLMRVDDEEKSASIYQYKLYKGMYDQSRPQVESATEQSAKEYWNSGVKGLSALLGSIATLLPGSGNAAKEGKDEKKN